MSLTAPERETVITFSDEDDTATIHTHQRRIITKLKNNPAAELIEDISFDGTAGAVFELPVWAISFLSKKRKGGPGNSLALQKAREIRGRDWANDSGRHRLPSASDGGNSQARGWRLAVAVLSAAALLAGLAGSAQASTLTINPANPEPGSGNNFPFGVGNIWPPYAGFVYKNVPSFSLKPGDKVAFDLGVQNGVDIQLQIDMAATTVNGGDVQTSGGFTTVATNTQLPQNPRGNTTNGDYELAFPVQLPFNFPGGGLIIRFSNPSGAFATDMTGEGVLVTRASSGDTSNQFVERFNGDADGQAPWTNAFPGEIGGFRLTMADTPSGSGGNSGSGTTSGKKCKKKKHRAASAKKKHCKKKK